MRQLSHIQLKVAQKHRVLWTYFWLITAKSTLIAYITLKISYIEGNKWIRYLCKKKKKILPYFHQCYIPFTCARMIHSPQIQYFLPILQREKSKTLPKHLFKRYAWDSWSEVRVTRRIPILCENHQMKHISIIKRRKLLEG